MNWKGKQLRTTEDFMRHGIDKCFSKEEAQQFIFEYVQEDSNARSTIGYLAGYYDNETKHRIFKWFDVVHPVFGTQDLPPEVAMQLGITMGRRLLTHSSPDRRSPWNVGLEKLQ